MLLKFNLHSKKFQSLVPPLFSTETETERLRLSIVFVSSETGTKISVSVSKISVFQYLQKVGTQGTEIFRDGD